MVTIYTGRVAAHHCRNEARYQAEKAQRLGQQRTAAAAAYIPVWQVAPRAWARPGISTPRFDGSGRVLLMELTTGTTGHRPSQGGER